MAAKILLLDELLNSSSSSSDEEMMAVLMRHETQIPKVRNMINIINEYSDKEVFLCSLVDYKSHIANGGTTKEVTKCTILGSVPVIAPRSVHITALGSVLNYALQTCVSGNKKLLATETERVHINRIRHQSSL
ncbi:hypothetical protein ACS0PU_011215 [Formica fusca]